MIVYKVCPIATGSEVGVVRSGVLQEGHQAVGGCVQSGEGAEWGNSPDCPRTDDTAARSWEIHSRYRTTASLPWELVVELLNSTT